MTRRRFDLTDFEWTVIQPLLPNKPRGVPRVDDRRVINGILWRFRTGSPWADVPDRYGPYTTCYNRFVRWRKAGVWDHVLGEISKAFDGDIVTARLAPPATRVLDGLRYVFNDVVSDVSYAGIAMRVEILGQERRRRWRDDEKLAIVVSVGDAGATITEVAHQHDITRQQIYAWRSELKKKGLLSASSDALFIPVDMKAVQMDVADDREKCSGMVELRLSCGRILRFGSAVDTSALTQLIRAVEAV